MAKAQAAQEKEAVEIPDYLKVADDDFDGAPGDTFGGESEILMLDEGMAAGPFSYLGHRLTDLGNGKAPADIHEAKDNQGDTWRLPIATNFRRQAEGADLKRGDTFFVKRLSNVLKKNGMGKGEPMQMYQIKVTVRAVAAATA